MLNETDNDPGRPEESKDSAEHPTKLFFKAKQTTGTFKTEPLESPGDASLAPGEDVSLGGKTELMMQSEGLTEEMPVVFDGQQPTEGIGMASAFSEEPAREVGFRDSATDDPSPQFNETEEVLVLLPDDGSGGDEIPLIETEPVGDPAIANAALRDVNPLVEDEFEPVEADEDGEGDNVGVMDEIAELANSLDQDILSAEAPGGHTTEGHGEEDEMYDEEDEAYIAASPKRRRRGLLVVAASLAAALVVGLFFYPTLARKFFSDSGTGTSVATALTRPAVDPGSDEGGVEDPAQPLGTAGELSPTRLAVRHQVLSAIELGLDWREQK